MTRLLLLVFALCLIAGTNRKTSVSVLRLPSSCKQPGIAR